MVVRAAVSHSEAGSGEADAYSLVRGLHRSIHMDRNLRFFDLPEVSFATARRQTLRNLEKFRVYGVRAIRLRVHAGDHLSASEWVTIDRVTRTLNKRQVRLEIELGYVENTGTHSVEAA